MRVIPRIHKRYEYIWDVTTQGSSKSCLWTPRISKWGEGPRQPKRGVTLTSVTNDDSQRIEDHLRTGMEAELVTARDELSKAAAHASSLEAELFAVATRLTAKEAEHEAAIAALAKMRDDLFEARTAVDDSQAKAEMDRAKAETDRATIAALKERIKKLENERSFTERAVRKVVRTVKR